MRKTAIGSALMIAGALATGCGEGGGSPAGGATESGAGDAGNASDTVSADGSSTDAGDDGDDGIPPEIECGDGVFQGPVFISPDDPAAMPVEILDGISIIEGDLLISSTGYANLDFLHCLTEIHGDVKIYDNDALVDISGTNGITKIGRLPASNPTPGDPNFVDEGKGTITISENDLLPDLAGFDGLVQIGEQDTTLPANMQMSPQSLVIRNNDALETISGFGNLQLIFASLIIQENPALGDIDGLSSLQGVGGIFSVTRNDTLCISSVNAVGEGLQLLGQPENSTTSLNDDSC